MHMKHKKNTNSGKTIKRNWLLLLELENYIPYCAFEKLVVKKN